MKFTVCLRVTGATGTFKDPFFPWLEYSYTLENNVYNKPEPGEVYPVSFHVTNKREDDSRVSGTLFFGIGVGNLEQNTDQVDYDIGSYQPAYLSTAYGCRYCEDDIIFTVEHTSLPNLYDYKCDIEVFEPDHWK